MLPGNGEDKNINVNIQYNTIGADKAAQGYALQGKAADDYYRKNAALFGQANVDYQNFMDNYVKQTNQGQQQTQKFTQNVQGLSSEFRGLRYAAMGLTQLGTLLAVGGGLLTAGIVKDAQDYVKYVGQSNELGAQWANTQEQIKQSSLQIGQTAAQIILPAMQTGADIMQRVANIIQANPWIVQAALGVGTAMAVVGATLLVVGRIVAVIADMGLMMSMIQKAQAAQLAEQATGGATAGAGGLATAGIITSGITGFLAINAGLVYGLDQLQESLSKLTQNSSLAKVVIDDLAQVLSVIPGLSAVFGFKQIEENLKNLTSPSAATPSQATIVPQQAIQDFINYQKQLNQAQQNYSQQRSDIITQYEQQVVDSTQAYEQQRADIVQSYSQNVAKANQSFADQQQKALTSYNDNVSKTIRDFNLQQQRAAQQHAIEMQRLEEQHNMRMNELAASRDALGLVKEQQSYQMQVDQKNQDYARQRAQARQDEQIKLSDMRQAFQQQQAEAQQAHQQQLADMAQQEADQLAKLDANHVLEMAKLDQQEKDKLQKLDEAYKKQVDDYQQAFVDRINAIDSAILGDTAAYQRYLENEAVQFQAWIQRFQQNAVASAVPPTTWFGAQPGTTGTITGYGAGYQYGGYANFFGAGETGLPEYVMNASTVRAAESMIGNRLTQASLLSSIMAGRGGGVGGSRSMQITVVGRSMSVTEIRSEIANALDSKLSDLLPAFGG